jgi:hypothetical protein
MSQSRYPLGITLFITTSSGSREILQASRLTTLGRAHAELVPITAIRAAAFAVVIGATKHRPRTGLTVIQEAAEAAGSCIAGIMAIAGGNDARACERAEHTSGETYTPISAVCVGGASVIAAEVRFGRGSAATVADRKSRAIPCSKILAYADLVTATCPFIARPLAGMHPQVHLESAGTSRTLDRRHLHTRS